MTLLTAVVTCIQIHAQLAYCIAEQRRQNAIICRTLLMTTLPRHRSRLHRGRFWTRPGRTSSWWDNFENEVVVIAEEWRENFRMSRTLLLSLSERLYPHIEGKTTVMLATVFSARVCVLHASQTCSLHDPEHAKKYNCLMLTLY